MSAPSYRNIEQGETLKIQAVAKRRDLKGPHVLSYENRYAPATSRCFANIFLQPAESWEYRVAGQQRSDDGRLLTVSYASGRL